MRRVDPKLLYVREEFAKWRHSRPGRRPRIPETLKSLAIALLASHSLRAVADELAINCNTLRDWRDRGIKPARIPDPSDNPPVTGVREEDFVELASPPEGIVELLLPTGVLLKVTPATPPSYVARLIAALRAVNR
jgi:transposase-like protein